MITIARSFTRGVAAASLLATALVTTATAVAAQGNDVPRGIWLAGSGSQTAVGTDWGHLTLRDGVLAFKSSTMEWQLAAADIKRASIEKPDRLLVESVAGETYYLTILDARMTAGSPREALKIIERALRAPAARRE